jgi:hypothetical protein
MSQDAWARFVLTNQAAFLPAGLLTSHATAAAARTASPLGWTLSRFPAAAGFGRGATALAVGGAAAINFVGANAALQAGILASSIAGAAGDAWEGMIFGCGP